MHRTLSSFLALALALVCSVSPVRAASPDEERVLGCGCEEAQLAGYLPFTRAIAVSGTVKDGLARSTVAAGIPPAVMLEGLKALATVIDPDRDIRDGDRFYVRYAQMFTAAGDPIEVGRIVWLELKTASKGTLALHRFKPANAERETLWLASGQGTQPAELDMPLASIAITSGFGMRADPVDQPWAARPSIGPIGPGGSAVSQAWKGKVIPAPSPLMGGNPINNPTPRGLAMGLSPPGFTQYGGFQVRGAHVQLHEGVDLVAAVGTPVYAAGDGVVAGAEPKGRYGNWIEIDHAGKLATVYGHLSAFAPGIVAGKDVKRGDLIGYTGNTGRTTGPHLHFEVRVNGRPTNPIGNAAFKHAQLRGPDLVKFRKLVTDELAEREREAKAM